MNINNKSIYTTKSILLNIIILLAWHIISFIACVYLKGEIFNCNKKMYQAKNWEKNGRWYKDKFKINKWKDLLPQFIGKGGFSKEHFNDTTIEYVDEFLYETCRSEWNHSINSLFAIFALIFNAALKKPFIGLVFAFITLLGNLPFLVIQRYNRFRLFTLKKKILRDMKRKQVK